MFKMTPKLHLRMFFIWPYILNVIWIHSKNRYNECVCPLLGKPRQQWVGSSARSRASDEPRQQWVGSSASSRASDEPRQLWVGSSVSSRASDEPRQLWVGSSVSSRASDEPRQLGVGSSVSSRASDEAHTEHFSLCKWQQFIELRCSLSQYWLISRFPFWWHGP